ncbi:unnamed protein product [Mytilus edulis]|uniref:Farnesoic acid O-methyl transferase domain-containing protein n=1 Tax=Mytilus edulis TaxID=6550 RepID=A0A8S3V315_MYTED|nr:unnamed protein product [Mytilus edulis]
MLHFASSPFEGAWPPAAKVSATKIASRPQTSATTAACKGTGQETAGRERQEDLLLKDHNSDIFKNLTKSISDRLINYKVKSCENAYVGLISGNTDSDPLYEIVIEEGWNPDSYIRIGRNNSGAKFSEISEYLLHCNFYRKFRTTWNDRTINLFRSSPQYPFWDRILTWTSVTNLWPILNVGICTMYGSTGQWLFYTSDLPTTSDETTALLESTTAGITRPPQITTANHLSTSTDGHPGN